MKLNKKKLQEDGEILIYKQKQQQQKGFFVIIRILISPYFVVVSMCCSCNNTISKLFCWFHREWESKLKISTTTTTKINQKIFKKKPFQYL